jgi:hypothetical protein
MSELMIGYARVSTDEQDLAAQRDELVALGVADDRVYVDHGLTGTHRDRPGLRQALAACRAGDTLVVTKLDRLARSVPDARAIADELTAGPSSAASAGMLTPSSRSRERSQSRSRRRARGSTVARGWRPGGRLAGTSTSWHALLTLPRTPQMPHLARSSPR